MKNLKNMTTNLGVRGSNPFGRAKSICKYLNYSGNSEDLADFAKSGLSHLSNWDSNADGPTRFEGVGLFAEVQDDDGWEPATVRF